MYRQTNVLVKALTPEVAKEMATMKEWKGDRTLKDWRLHMLLNKVSRKAFHTPTWATAKFKGRAFRMNGQHSSHMLDNLDNGQFPNGLKVVILEFGCDTEQDMCELFSEFDNRRSTRSPGDIAKAHASIHSTLNDLSEVSLTFAVSGIAFSLSKDAPKRRVSADERARLIHDYTDFVLWVSQFQTRPGFRRVGIAGALFSSWERDAEGAAKFWTWVARQSHVDPEHVSRMLARFLIRATSTRGVTPNEYYAKSVYAWNAWRRKESLTTLRYLPKSPLPTPV